MPKWWFVSLLLVAIWQLAVGWYIPAKAQLAQWLLQQAWQQGQAQQVDIRPWPWADIWPVARLQSSEHQVDLIVLDGDSGAALAFAPGLRYIDSTGQVVMISGHRDTHFRFVQRLNARDTISLLHRDGRQQHFHIVELKIVDSRKPLQLRAIDSSLLVLVTCYPFESLQAGGPLRYVVVAQETLTPIQQIHSQQAQHI